MCHHIRYLKKKAQNGQNVIFQALGSLNFVPKLLWTDFEIFIGNRRRNKQHRENPTTEWGTKKGPKQPEKEFSQNFRYIGPKTVYIQNWDPMTRFREIGKTWVFGQIRKCHFSRIRKPQHCAKFQKIPMIGFWNTPQTALMIKKLNSPLINDTLWRGDESIATNRLMKTPVWLLQ